MVCADVRLFCFAGLVISTSLLSYTPQLPCDLFSQQNLESAQFRPDFFLCYYHRSCIHCFCDCCWCPRPDTGKSVKLKRLCISGNFPISGYSKTLVDLIDVLWIKNGKIKYAFEVENSTTITSALERCSPLHSSETKKIIVLPSQRKAKLASKMKTPFFKKWLDDEKWKRIWYEDLDKMTGTDIDKIIQ